MTRTEGGPGWASLGSHLISWTRPSCDLLNAVTTLCWESTKSLAKAPGTIGPLTLSSLLRGLLALLEDVGGQPDRLSKGTKSGLCSPR